MKNQPTEVIDLISDDDDEDDDEVKVLEGVERFPPVSVRPASVAAIERAGCQKDQQHDTIEHYQRMSISELKRQLTERAINFADCIEKTDLVRRLNSGSREAATIPRPTSLRSTTSKRDVFPAKVISVNETNPSSTKVPTTCATRDSYGPLADGETTVVPGSKAGSNYTIKRTGQVYYCTCPAWKFQSTNKGRTCKHINALRAGYAPNHVGVASFASPKKRKAAAASLKKVPHSNNKNDKNNNKVPKTNNPMTNNPTMNNTRSNFQVTLADTWNPDKHDPTGYYLSEKLDGQRCVWDGTALWSRTGHRLDTAPAWFTNDLPADVWLDGELFLGRGRFQELQSCKASATDPRWRQVQLVVFDAPQVPGDFPTRLAALQRALGGCSVARVLEQAVCTGRTHVEMELEAVLGRGGEGVMLRNPQTPYEHKRTQNLLKVKRWHDAEAVVVAHVPGKGKHQGRMGALQCRMTTNCTSKTFKLGTGFNDAVREHPPTVGTIVTYKYQELTNGGIPRFPVFLRVRGKE